MTATATWACLGVSFTTLWPEPDFAEEACTFFAPWQTGHEVRQHHHWEARREPTGPWTLRMASGEPLEEARDAEEMLLVAELQTFRAVVESPQVPPSLHACILGLPDGSALALVGTNNSGKSSLGIWLWHRLGLDLLSDDAAVLSPDAPGSVWAVPRRISVRTSSRQLLGEDLWSALGAQPFTAATAQGFVFRPHNQSRPNDRPHRLKTLVLLERRGSSAPPGNLRPVDPCDAVFALAPLLRGCHEGTAQAIRSAALLADRVPVFDLGRDALPQMAASLEDLLA